MTTKSHSLRRLVRVVAISSSFALALLGACAEDVPISGAPCPCATGWTCCPDQTCAAEGELCGTDERLEALVPGGLMLSAFDESIDLGVRPGVCGGSLDKGSDGTIETTWSIDTRKDSLTALSDTDQDGTADSRLFVKFQAPGQPSFSSVDADNDDINDWETTWERLPDGRVKTLNVSFGPDGDVTGHLTFHWSYFVNRTIFDTLTPGTFVGERHVAFRDAEGRFVTEEVYRADTNGNIDDVLDQLITNTFGPRGLAERRSVSPDGSTSVTTYHYDGAGRFTGYTVDDGADGSIDSSLLRTFDSDGRLARRQFTSASESWTREYDYDCR